MTLEAFCALCQLYVSRVASREHEYLLDVVPEEFQLLFVEFLKFGFTIPKAFKVLDVAVRWSSESHLPPDVFLEAFGNCLPEIAATSV